MRRARPQSEPKVEGGEGSRGLGSWGGQKASAKAAARSALGTARWERKKHDRRQGFDPRILVRAVAEGRRLGASPRPAMANGGQLGKPLGGAFRKPASEGVRHQPSSIRRWLRRQLQQQQSKARSGRDGIELNRIEPIAVVEPKSPRFFRLIVFSCLKIYMVCVILVGSARPLHTRHRGYSMPIPGLDWFGRRSSKDSPHQSVDPTVAKSPYPVRPNTATTHCPPIPSPPSGRRRSRA